MTAMRFDASDFSLALTGNLSRFRKGVADAHMIAARGALKRTGDYGKTVHRASLRRAGMGGPLEKAWQYELYPKSKLVSDPALYFYTKAPVIIAAVNEGATIMPTGEGMLAIPIPDSFAEDFPNPAGPETKVDYARKKFGDRLFVIPPRGDRPAILAARMVGATRTGKLSAFNKTKTGKFRKGTMTAPLFYLIEQAQLKKSIDIDRDFARMERRLLALYPVELQKALAAQGID